MEDTSRFSPGGPTPWSYQTGQDHLAQPVVLLVEDDRDIREMIATLLDMAGFTVVPCDTAECGLNALREQEFDLVLTDYALPRKSGLWLLEEAESEGLIQGIPVLIVTAHPSVDDETDYEVIHKPFDLDELVDRVRRRMEGTGGGRRKRPAVSSRTGSGTNGDQPECPEPV